MGSLVKLLAATAALALSTAGTAATFGYGYKLSRDGETLTGSGRLFTDAGVANGDVTIFSITSADGAVTYDYDGEGFTTPVLGLVLFAGAQPQIFQAADGSLSGQFALFFDDRPYAIGLDSSRTTAFVTESNWDVDSLTFTALASDVPEPASWALMIAGFGLAGTAARTRRTTVTYA